MKPSMLKFVASLTARGVLLLFLSASACVSANDADSPINIFPSQTAAKMILESMPPELRSTLSDASSEPSPEMSPTQVPEPESGPPFEVSGEWVEPDRHIIVLHGMGRVFLLCRRCGSLPDVIRPGQPIAGGFRLKSLRGSDLVLIGPDRREHHLAVAGH
ncbi:hypothetical protein PCO31010_03146 [Pandoraea commovens]|uniref:Uncharacterized protein n=1 Tax=Pandoraea commovens TaxID=2508289 RepID=A0A5E4W6W0_9BURK|nr:hypothetical protein PCO31010_03146 [Pandoraea commovens]